MSVRQPRHKVNPEKLLASRKRDRARKRLRYNILRRVLAIFGVAFVAGSLFSLLGFGTVSNESGVVYGADRTAYSIGIGAIGAGLLAARFTLLRRPADEVDFSRPW